MNKQLLRPAEAYLYKYGSCDLSKLKSIITKDELYFPTSRELNDPAEAKPRLARLSLEKILSFLYDMYVINNPGLSSESYQRAKVEIDSGARFGSQLILKEMSRLLYGEFEKFHIYSMTKRPDNMACWANYADDHKGYCLEFSNSGLFAAAFEVSYVDNVDFDPTDPEQRNAYFLFQKTLDWQTEEELRLVLPRGSNAIIQFDPNLLTRIIVGQHMLERSDR